MAVVVNLVIEPGDELTEDDVVGQLLADVEQLQRFHRVLGGSIVGVDRFVDLTPTTPAEPES